MTMTRRRRFSRVFAGGVLATALSALLLAAPAVALKTPGLASSAQYKAFIEYVKKLNGFAGQNRTQETKNTYEAKLTAKKTAAAHKANALFNRASEEAQAEANETAKEQVSRVRVKEGQELEIVKGDANRKLEGIAASYAAKNEAIVNGHKNREKAIKGQIAELRGKKAKAGQGHPKEVIQERIEKKSGEIAANREDEKEKRSGLKNATAKQEATITEGLKETEAGIVEGAEGKVKKIDKHWNKAYEEKKASLNTTRENRLAYLETKLEQGRAAIAAMPSSG
jgi:hypothetical protein